MHEFSYDSQVLIVTDKHVTDDAKINDEQSDVVDNDAKIQQQGHP